MIDQTADKPGRGPRSLPLSRTPGGPWRVIIWGLLILLVIGGLVWIAYPRHATQAARGRFALTGPMPVAVAAAQTGAMPIIFNALGTVTSLATVTVKTQINGQLSLVAFQEGQLVHQGDLLAVIDPRPYQAALDQAQGNLIHDQALLANAEVDLKRYRTLVAQDSIATQQLDTQAALVRQYQGTVRSDQATVDNAKLNLTYCHIVSPITGRVGLRQVDQGNYVQTSDANGLVVITQVQPITVIFTLPEDNLQAVLKQLRAGATLTVTAYDRSQSTKLATGTLMTIDNQIDVTTGTFKLRAMFDNPDEALFPNQFVNVTLLVDTEQNVVVVPSSAIQRGAPGTFVYTVQPDSTVKVEAVKLGATANDQVVIASGLDAGARVVVDGADKLRDGAKVTIPDQQAAAPTGAPATAKGAAPAHPQGAGQGAPQGQANGPASGQGAGQENGQGRGHHRNPQ